MQYRGKINWYKERNTCIRDFKKNYIIYQNIWISKIEKAGHLTGQTGTSDFLMVQTSDACETSIYCRFCYNIDFYITEIYAILRCYCILFLQQDKVYYSDFRLS